MQVQPTYRFARVPEWLLFHPEVDDLAIRVYAALDRWGTEVYPSLTTVGERIGKSEDTARRGIRTLERLGALRAEPRYDGDGRQTSNLYTLAGDAPLQGRGRESASHGGRESASHGGRESATQKRARKNESNSNEKPIAPAAADAGADMPPAEPMTLNQRVRKLAVGYYDWMTEQAGRKPSALTVPQLIGLLKPFLANGVEDRALKVVLKAMYEEGETVTRQAIERRLDGRARRGRAAKPSMMEGLRALQFDDDGNLVTPA